MTARRQHEQADEHGHPRWIHSIHAAVSPSGGISEPWQVGQSGQPMPEPVERTMAPMTIST